LPASSSHLRSGASNLYVGQTDLGRYAILTAERCQRFVFQDNDGRWTLDYLGDEFDYVKTAREARDRISAEIDGMSHEQLVSWLRSHRYADPLLARLAAKAAQHADPAAGASPGR
jgi:hypothetical protein